LALGVLSQMPFNGNSGHLQEARSSKLGQFAMAHRARPRLPLSGLPETLLLGASKESADVGAPEAQRAKGGRKLIHRE
jgi:hypothetical protein